MVSDGPSLIKSCDFCMSMKLNNACTLHPGLVSIPFCAIPIFPSKFQFFNLLVH